jgi:hypothetical protein
LSEGGDQLFLHSEKTVTVPDTKVLFSFGSGDWADGLEAREATSELDGRWINLQLTSMKHRVIVDKKNCVPPFDKLDLVKQGTLMPLDQVLDAFVAAGEIGITMTHHTLTRESSVWSIKPKADLCFVLDQPKDTQKPTKK